jgi:hypothetical protein
MLRFDDIAPQNGALTGASREEVSTDIPKTRCSKFKVQKKCTFCGTAALGSVTNSSGVCTRR